MAKAPPMAPLSDDEEESENDGHYSYSDDDGDSYHQHHHHSHQNEQPQSYQRTTPASSTTGSSAWITGSRLRRVDELNDDNSGRPPPVVGGSLTSLLQSVPPPGVPSYQRTLADRRHSSYDAFHQLPDQYCGSGGGPVVYRRHPDVVADSRPPVRVNGYGMTNGEVGGRPLVSLFDLLIGAKCCLTAMRLELRQHGHGGHQQRQISSTSPPFKVRITFNVCRRSL